MTQKKRHWRHQRNQMDSRLRPLESHHIPICESISRTEKLRSYVVDTMQTLSKHLRERQVGLTQGVLNMATDMEQLRRDGKHEAKPKTIPPWLAQFYVNRHVDCSNDRTIWHDATLTLTHTSLNTCGIMESPE